MMKSKADEEDYWNSSKYNAFTFDDADDELSALKETKKAVNRIGPLLAEDDEEEWERVSWSGEPVGSISWSVKEMAASNQRADREPAFPKISTETPSLSKSQSGISLSSLFKGKPKGGNLQTFNDVLGDSSLRLYTPELRKPKSEYKDLVSDWSAEETVQRLQQGKGVTLEKFRSLQDKLLLLDLAVAAHDGNAITAVLIYLKRTLCKEVLFRELESRQTALRHFIHYLTESREQRLLLELLRALGRTEEAALLQYKDYKNIADENKRRDFLKSCLSLQFGAEDGNHVQDHYTLLERQIIIEAADRKAEREGKLEVFQKFPRKASILHMPLITTLYYCCFYHYNEPEGTFSSPLNVRQTFKISEKQYFTTALAARAKLKNWADVDAMFNSRNWLGFSKKKSPLSFQRVVDILQKNSAPTRVLQEYVGLVSDAELRIGLAQKHKCHDIVINTYRDMKDRQQLAEYRKKVERGSAEERKIDELLSNQQIRWKN
ncbi:spermatogenesis-defective protein 39 homolog [Poecilia reticulata]|uniref:Spermatogenesis-defective protein 39 homolog n=1 Tax=Poecilia reticulata TaxID=8081 RepID=A0A3P9PF15_POERE|nr:PREDICTED: spermatogenesis-defective protein 39 homolog [Poecilia reticulata]XP_008395283.1 PREDICTED: spermatogenesis-defective protein 39 homolog [Poecilia reticulata]